MPARLKLFFNPPGQPGKLVSRLFWTALAVRLLYVTLAHTYRIRLSNDHFEFGWEMGRIARSLATGYGYSDPFEGHTGPTAWTPPLYPLILAGVFKIFGVYTNASAWVILAINSVFSAATAPTIYQIARRAFARSPDALKIAVWSGWLWAFYPAAMQYAVKWVWDMSLTACLFAWVILLALKLRDESSTSRWLLFGSLWGLIALSNSSLLAFLPFCALWIIWPTSVDQKEPSFWRSQNLRSGRYLHERQGAPSQSAPSIEMGSNNPNSLSSNLRNLTLAALCTLAIVSPWILRNQLTFHAFVPLRSNFGAELYESAQLENEGYPTMATLPHSESSPDFQRYKRLGELAYSREQGDRAKAIIRAHPATFASHILKRAYFFWASVPHPTEHGWKGIAAETAREFSYAFLSLAGILGLALALRDHVPAAWLFFWAFAVYPLLYYAITVQARFRHPLEPLICILAVYLFRSAKPKQSKA